MLPATDHAGSEANALKKEENALDKEANDHIKRELRDPRHHYDISKLKEKLSSLKSDIPELLAYSAMFYNQMWKGI